MIFQRASRRCASVLSFTERAARPSQRRYFPQVAALSAADPDHAGCAGACRSCRSSSVLIDEGIEDVPPKTSMPILIGMTVITGTARARLRALGEIHGARGIPAVCSAGRTSRWSRTRRHRNADAICVADTRELSWPRVAARFRQGRNGVQNTQQGHRISI